MVDALETRLCGHEGRVTDADGVLGHANALQTKFMDKARALMNAVGTQGLMRSGKLVGRFTTIMPKYCDALQRARNAPDYDAPSINDVQTLSPWLAWLKPTVGWLMSDASDQSWLRRAQHQSNQCKCARASLQMLTSQYMP